MKFKRKRARYAGKLSVKKMDRCLAACMGIRDPLSASICEDSCFTAYSRSKSTARYKRPYRALRGLCK